MIGSTVDIHIDIVAWHDDHQPGLVECRLIDAHGKAWTFVEKVPIVTEAMLESTTSYPQPGTIRGIVVDTPQATDGQEIVTIDTTLPWRIEDLDCVTRFDVRPDQLAIC